MAVFAPRAAIAVAFLSFASVWACGGPDFRSDGSRDDFVEEPDPVVGSDDAGGGGIAATDTDSGAPLDDDSGVVTDDGGTSKTDASVSVAVDLKDCSSIECPATAPYPVGCNIKMQGGSDQACAAGKPGDKRVYFKEGSACGSEKITGQLFCSPTMGVALDKNNCPLMNSDGSLRKDPRYPDNDGACPGN